MGVLAASAVVAIGATGVGLSHPGARGTIKTANSVQTRFIS